MTKHLPERRRRTMWARFGVLTLLLVLVGGAAVAGPRIFEPRPGRAADPTPTSPAPTPSASGTPTPSAALSPRRVVPQVTLEPAEPSPSAEGPRDAKGKKAKARLRAMREAAEAAQAAEEAAAAVPPLTFRMASFNVLGSSHTSGGGNKPGFADGRARIGWTADLLRSQGVEVVGFQEYEPNQHQAFVQRTGWGVYPGMSLGTKGVRNSVAWNPASWQLIEAHTTPIPYFRGTPVPMPYVLLEHRETGRRAWVISIHNPTSNPRRGNNQRWRNVATQRERALLTRLHATGTPVLLTGDFNERAEAFCQITAGGVAQAANGGSGGPPCRAPGNMGIDWIFGTPDVTFSGYLRNQGPLVQRASDHPMILSDVTLEGD